MKYLPFGKTGVSLSEVGFGGIPIVRLAPEESDRVLKRAFDRGITLFDTANSYKGSEEKIGRALAPVRDKIFLATKSKNRDGKGMAEHIDLSLKRMKTDYIDLYQFHMVVQEDDWNAIMAPGGAMEAALDARRKGKIRFIGLTSHGVPMALKAVASGHFASIQFPFNFIENEAAKELHPLARKLGVAILAMKPFGGGALTDASLAFKFLRSYHDLFPIPGFDSVESVDEITEIYNAPNSVTQADRETMDRIEKELGKEFCRRCEYCQPCPSGVSITMGMTYPLIAHRMSPEVASEYLREPLETLPKCVECGLCTTKCPYGLPIPSTLKKNYELYRSHRKEK